MDKGILIQNVILISSEYHEEIDDLIVSPLALFIMPTFSTISFSNSAVRGASYMLLTLEPL